MNWIILLLICIACFTIDCTGVLVYAPSSNDSVIISSNSTTKILDSNGSKNYMASGYMNNTSDDLAARLLHGKNIKLKRGKRSTACEDGVDCGQDCCRYEEKIKNICRGNNCWGDSVKIVARGFKFPKRLRKIFLDVINWWRDMWYAYRVKNYKVIRVPEIKKIQVGEGGFISLNGGWMLKKIFVQFSGPITITKKQLSKDSPHIVESFDLHLWNTYFGYEFKFDLGSNGRRAIKGRVYITYRSLLIKLFVMTVKKNACAASQFQLHMVPNWADYKTKYDSLSFVNTDRRMLEDVEKIINSFISSDLLKQVLVPAVKKHFEDFFKTSNSLVYHEFKKRGIDLCKEVKHLFD